MRRRVLLTAAVLVGTAALIGPFGDVGGATNVSVSTEAEYRQALIDLSADGSGPHTISITSDFAISTPGDPTYSGTQDLTIDGNGNGVNATVANTRFLAQIGSAELVLQDLTVIGFSTSGAGGALNTTGSQLTVQGSDFFDNEATVAGGAIAFASGAIVEQSGFTGNRSGGSGGAIVQSNDGGLEVEDSTFFDNTSAGAGSALAGLGLLSVVNSTLVGNVGPSTITSDDISLTYTTLADNQLVPGQQVELGVVSNPNAPLTSFGTVIVGATGGPECVVAGSTSTFTYSDDASCDLAGLGDVEDGASDPGLGALQNSGGPTETIALEPGSPLLDVIPQPSCSPDGVTEDQRGLPRPGDPELQACDIGAFELQGAPVGEEPPEAPGAGTDAGTATTGGPVAGRPGFTG